MRPDERAAQAEIERSLDTQGKFKKAGKTALNIGATALGVPALSGLSSKILPFLSEHIPMDLAIKGINKLSPELGKYLKKGRDMGLNIQDGLNFVKESMQPKEEEQSKSKPKGTGNFLEQNAPEIHEALKEEIGKGLSPLGASKTIGKTSKFNKKIKDLEKKAGTTFDKIVEAIFGQEGQSGMGQQEALQKFNTQKKPSMQEELTEQFQGAYPQAQGQSQSQGIDPGVARIVQQGEEIIRRFRGQ